MLFHESAGVFGGHKMDAGCLDVMGVFRLNAFQSNSGMAARQGPRNIDSQASRFFKRANYGEFYTEQRCRTGSQSPSS